MEETEKNQYTLCQQCQVSYLETDMEMGLCPVCVKTRHHRVGPFFENQCVYCASTKVQQSNSRIENHNTVLAELITILVCEDCGKITKNTFRLVFKGAEKID